MSEFVTGAQIYLLQKVAVRHNMPILKDVSGPHPTLVAVIHGYLDVVALAEEVQARVWQDAELTLVQIRALRSLVREPKPLGQLGADLRLSPTSVTRLIDRLEQAGLAVRLDDSQDRRRVVAAPTDAGRDVVSAVPLLEYSDIRAAMERLAPAERQRIATAFTDFVAAVRETQLAELPS
jgi:DNA-binding MarR family transcriptional regulator